ncbi:MAG: Spy/CpxP family protein refolding chaperone [Muribaculaceae bacterium]
MNKFFTFITLSLMCLCYSAQAFAQMPVTDADRQRWLAEIRQYKHEFLIKELDLTEEQQGPFFQLYDQMEDEIEQLNSQTRALQQQIETNEQATDLEVTNAARTVFELKRAEGQIEMTYFDRFAKILTPRQLLNLKPAERKFTQHLVNHHRRQRTTAGHQ